MGRIVLDVCRLTFRAFGLIVLLAGLNAATVTNHTTPVSTPTSGITAIAKTATGMATFAAEALRDVVNGPTPASGERAQLTSNAEDVSNIFDVDAATAVLTEPDDGPAGITYRWEGPQVDVFIDKRTLNDPDQYDRITDVLAWLSDTTGVRFVPTNDPAAPMTVKGSDSRGGVVHVSATDTGTIVTATADIGVGRTRVMYEEILQAAGPLGDKAGRYSVFSQSKTQMTPSRFDLWVLSTLYSLPPGSTPATVRTALERSLPR